MSDLPKLHHHKQSSRVGKSAVLPIKSERRRLNRVAREVALPTLPIWAVRQDVEYETCRRGRLQVSLPAVGERQREGVSASFTLFGILSPQEQWH